MLSERYETIWDFGQKFDISVELKMPWLRSHDFYGLDYQKSDRIIRRLPWILEVEEDKRGTKVFEELSSRRKFDK